MEFFEQPLTATAIAVTRANSDRFLFGSESFARSFVSFLCHPEYSSKQTYGYVSELLLIGVGLRVDSRKGAISLSLGYSHDIYVFLGSKTGYKIFKQYLVLFSYSKAAVTNIGAITRGFRRPDTYKAKGVRYLREAITTKRGKQKQQK